MDYYVIINDQRRGPLSADELLDVGLKPQTPVWREGLADWMPASQVPGLAEELESARRKASFALQNESVYFFVMLDGHQRGPYSIADLQRMDLAPATPVWREGMPDWKRADSVSELEEIFRRNTPPPFRSHAPGQNYAYSNPENSSSVHINPTPRRSAWMGWAITATLINFISVWPLWFPLIGLILGIVGIVCSSNANSSWAGGYDSQAESSENTSKICTILSLISAGAAVTLFLLGIFFVTSLFAFL